MTDDEKLAGFLAAPWINQIKDDFMKRSVEGNRMMMRLSGVDPDNMPERWVRQDRSAAWLAKRKKFKRQFKKLVKEGLKQEWLKQGSCFECGGELEVTKDVTHLVAEPNPDFDPDKPKLYDLTGVTSIRIASGNLSAT